MIDVESGVTPRDIGRIIGSVIPDVGRVQEGFRHTQSRFRKIGEEFVGGFRDVWAGGSEDGLEMGEPFNWREVTWQNAGKALTVALRLMTKDSKIEGIDISGSEVQSMTRSLVQLNELTVGEWRQVMEGMRRKGVVKSVNWLPREEGEEREMALVETQSGGWFWLVRESVESRGRVELRRASEVRKFEKTASHAVWAKALVKLVKDHSANVGRWVVGTGGMLVEVCDRETRESATLLLQPVIDSSGVQQGSDWEMLAVINRNGQADSGQVLKRIKYDRKKGTSRLVGGEDDMVADDGKNKSKSGESSGLPAGPVRIY